MSDINEKHVCKYYDECEFKNKEIIDNKKIDICKLIPNYCKWCVKENI